jgi:hypothetical protein
MVLVTATNKLKYVGMPIGSLWELFQVNGSPRKNKSAHSSKEELVKVPTRNANSSMSWKEKLHHFPLSIALLGILIEIEPVGFGTILRRAARDKPIATLHMSIKEHLNRLHLQSCPKTGIIQFQVEDLRT